MKKILLILMLLAERNAYSCDFSLNWSSDIVVKPMLQDVLFNNNSLEMYHIYTKKGCDLSCFKKSLVATDVEYVERLPVFNINPSKNSGLTISFKIIDPQYVYGVGVCSNRKKVVPMQIPSLAQMLGIPVSDFQSRDDKGLSRILQYKNITATQFDKLLAQLSAMSNNRDITNAISYFVLRDGLEVMVSYSRGNKFLSIVFSGGRDEKKSG